MAVEQRPEKHGILGISRTVGRPHREEFLAALAAQRLAVLCAKRAQGRFDRLDDYLRKFQAKEHPTKESKGKDLKVRSTKHGRKK